MDRLRRDVNYYEAHAQTVNLKYITSGDDNAAILQKLRDNDPEFTWLGIKAAYPDNEDDFAIRREDDLGWLGYFVAKNSTLQNLYMDINGVPGFEFWSISNRIGVFIDGLNQNRSIEKLHIGSDLGSKNFRRMGDFFKNNNNLRELSFGIVDNMGVDSARSIAYILSQRGQKSLRKISFDDSDASDAVLAEIAVAIRNHSLLEELDLDRNNLGREGCKALGNALKVCRNPQLQILYLQNNFIDDVGLSSLVTGLRNCRNLRKLSLTGNELITVGGFRSLSTLFQSERCCLECLVLDSMNIRDDGVRTILAGLARLHSLQELHLSHNAIGNDGANALTAGLANIRSLKILNLSNNSIGDDGAGTLATGLVELRSLKQLYLSGNSFSDDGISALAPVFASLQSLEGLYLARNLIGDDGLQALVGNISHCCKLSTLYLSANELVTVTGLRNLSTLLRSDNCSLVSLYLQEINFGDDGATALANGLKGNMMLESLLFDSRGLTPVGWSAFSRLLCDTSSVNSTYLSNHTLNTIGSYTSFGTPDDVKHSLALNQQLAGNEVAIQKIVESHPNFDVESMFQWKLKLLPHVMCTLERVRTPRYVFDEDQDVLVSKYSGQTLRRKLQSMKLSTVYKFVRGMPLVVVEVDAYRRYIEAALLAPIPRKRNFEQLYD